MTRPLLLRPMKEHNKCASILTPSTEVRCALCNLAQDAHLPLPNIKKEHREEAELLKKRPCLSLSGYLTSNNSYYKHDAEVPRRQSTQATFGTILVNTSERRAKTAKHRGHFYNKQYYLYNHLRMQTNNHMRLRIAAKSKMNRQPVQT